MGVKLSRSRPSLSYKEQILSAACRVKKVFVQLTHVRANSRYFVSWREMLWNEKKNVLADLFYGIGPVADAHAVYTVLIMVYFSLWTQHSTYPKSTPGDW